MSARGVVRLNRSGRTRQQPEVPAGPFRVRRGHPPVPAPRATQQGGRRRPGGVRGPRLAPQRRVGGQRALGAPPVMFETGSRLTDRGLAVVMSLMVMLVIAAVVCIATTALRVTAEPPTASAAGARSGQ